MMLVSSPVWAFPSSIEYGEVVCDIGASAYVSGFKIAQKGIAFDTGFKLIDGAFKRKGAAWENFNEAVLLAYADGYQNGAVSSVVGKEDIDKVRNLFKADCLARWLKTK